MSVKRLVVFVAPFALVSTFVIGGENPFARWEQAKQKTAVQTPQGSQPTVSTASTVATPAPAPTKLEAKPRTRPALEYFSASASESAKADSTEPVAAQKSSENKVADSASVPQTDPSETVGRVVVERLQINPQGAPSNSSTPATIPQSGGSLPPSTAFSDTSEGNSGFTTINAAFQPKTNSRTILQTTAQFEEPNNASDQSNPFADFVNEANPISTQGPFDGKPVGNASPFKQTTESQFKSGDSDGPDSPPEFDNKAFNAPATNVAPKSAAPSHSGPQTPSVTIQWVHHGEFNVGQECSCDLVIENSGTSAVRNVVAEAVLPEGVEVVSAVPAPVANGGSASWTFAELDPGQSRKIELIIVPRQQGDMQMNAYVRLTGASTTSFSVREPLLALQLEGPGSVAVGQLANYTINVTNPGSGQAKNVVIQAVIPEGLEHRRGRMLTIDIGTLNPRESRRARLSLTGVSGGEHKLAVRAVADGGLNDQTIETIAVAEPRLNIGIRGPARSMASQSSDFEVIVVNEGKVDSSNVRAKYRVPEGYDFVKADRGGKFNPAEKTIDWFVGTLEPGQLKNFNVSLRPTAPGEFKHQVGVISEHGKMTLAEHVTGVQGSARLTLKVASNKSQVAANGGEVSFEIRISNTGNTAAESVGLSCEIPPGLELIDVSGPSEFMSDSGVIIFRALPALASGESAVFVVRTKCGRSGRHSARVRVASQSIGRALIDEKTVNGVDR